MIKWFEETIRDYKKNAIMKRFSKFSKFKGSTRIDEFRELGLYLKSIRFFSYKYDCLDKLLERFDCIQIDEGWNIGQDCLLKNQKAKYPILYCYKGEENKDQDFSLLEKQFYDNLYKYGSQEIRIKDNPTSIYHHLRVKPSAMGAWQVFLLELYPFIINSAKRSLGKPEESFVFTDADVKLINKKYHINIDNKHDISPYVWMKENVAYVTCCSWFSKGGIQRYVYTIIFEGDRVKDIMKDGETVEYSTIN